MILIKIYVLFVVCILEMLSLFSPQDDTRMHNIVYRVLHCICQYSCIDTFKSRTGQLFHNSRLHIEESSKLSIDQMLDSETRIKLLNVVKMHIVLLKITYLRTYFLTYYNV